MFEMSALHACSLSSHLELAIGKILSKEERRIVPALVKRSTSLTWRIRETSLTDFIILSFVSLNSTGVQVDITDEKTTGSDLDLYVLNPWGTKTYSIQAKRALPKLDKATSQLTNGVYRELGHKVKFQPQYDLLINHAVSLRSEPLYLFYHSDDVINACLSSAHKKLPSSLCGASVVDGYIIKQNFDGNVYRRLETKTYRDAMRRFSSLFCPPTSVRKLGDKTVVSQPTVVGAASEVDQLTTGAESPQPEEPPMEIDAWQERSRELGCSVRIVVDQRS